MRKSIIAIAFILILGILFFIFTNAMFRSATVEDQNITIREATVTHADITHSSNTGTRYQLSVANEDFATVIVVSPEIYAKHKVGNQISVTVTETRYKNGDTMTDYGIS